MIENDWIGMQSSVLEYWDEHSECFHSEFHEREVCLFQKSRGNQNPDKLCNGMQIYRMIAMC